jgi:hypothetical protein
MKRLKILSFIAVLSAEHFCHASEDQDGSPALTRKDRGLNLCDIPDVRVVVEKLKGEKQAEIVGSILKEVDDEVQRLQANSSAAEANIKADFIGINNSEFPHMLFGDEIGMLVMTDLEERKASTLHELSTTMAEIGDIVLTRGDNKFIIYKGRTVNTGQRLNLLKELFEHCAKNRADSTLVASYKEFQNMGSNGTIADTWTMLRYNLFSIPTPIPEKLRTMPILENFLFDKCIKELGLIPLTFQAALKMLGQVNEELNIGDAINLDTRFYLKKGEKDQKKGQLKDICLASLKSIKTPIASSSQDKT